MRPTKTWANAGDTETYVLDFLRPGVAPQSVYALLSNSKLRVVHSLEADAFSDISLTTGTPAKRITGIACSMVGPNPNVGPFDSVIWSCSSEGVVAAWDLIRSPTPAFVSPNKNGPLACIGVGLNGTLVAAGTEEGVESKILFWDVRNLSSTLAIFDESHSDSVTNLCFNPLGSPMMLSGSLDGLVCAFDLSKPNESTALSSVLNANSACSHIGFFGANYEGIYATTRTETFSIFELESSLTISAYEYDLVKGTGCRETLQSLSGMEVNYLIDCSWESQLQKLLLLAGNSNGDGFGFDVGLDGFHPLDALKGGHKDVIRCGKVYEGPVIVTGGEDGRLCSWSLE